MDGFAAFQDSRRHIANATERSPGLKIAERQLVAVVRHEQG